MKARRKSRQSVDREAVEAWLNARLEAHGHECKVTLSDETMYRLQRAEASLNSLMAKALLLAAGSDTQGIVI